MKNWELKRRKELVAMYGLYPKKDQDPIQWLENWHSVERGVFDKFKIIDKHYWRVAAISIIVGISFIALCILHHIIKGGA